ncbi:MAG TPA: alginate lyase family protein, partial [Burkholderiaceae bacterium]
PDAARRGRPFVATEAPPGIDRGALLRAADALLDGRWNVFALHGARLGFPPRWNRDPKTGAVAPLSHGEGIDYRDEAVVGDIKYLWEPNRHLELVTLAQAWALTRQARYAEGARTLLESWLEQCPYPRGVHWTSALEVALRLVNWSVAWQILEATDAPLFGDGLRARWLAAVYRHAHFVRSHLSAHSSANNHLFGEYLGLFLAGTTWPCWGELVQWREFARAGLETEALRQNSADGVNREQAIYYQHEVMDMMLLALQAARAQGQDFSAPFAARLERMAEFVHALMDAGGHVPMQGDADDAAIVRLAPGAGFDPYRSLLASCALLFARRDFRHKAGALDDKTRWLLPDAAARWDALPAEPAPPRMAFFEGGHYLLGADFDTPHEVRIAVDCAPLGYLSIAAHGHADALSFTLSAGGRELLVDPGTYAYHTEREWRDHFRGTPAHNTVTVDGEDQSVIGGPFMWLAKARARLVAHVTSGTPQRFVGEHDGYTRLPDPVRHRRELRYDPARRRLTVIDTLDAEAPHEVEIAWHFAEDAVVSLDDGEPLLATSGPVSLRLACEHPGFAPSLHRGEEVPRKLGWVSRRFDERVPAATVVFRGRIERPTSITTQIALRFAT